MVLLSVLLILALLSAITYQMVGRQSLVVAQARQTFSGDQALEYALGGEAFARQILYEDWSQTGQGVDNLTEAWAQPLAPFEVEDGFLEIQIRDLNGCFNLNSVAQGDVSSGLSLRPAGVNQFRALMKAVARAFSFSPLRLAVMMAALSGLADAWPAPRAWPCGLRHPSPPDHE